MAHLSSGHGNYAPFERHPLTAALLSFLPGLGQLYVGDKRKGILFLDVTAVNAVLLWLMLCTQPLLQCLTKLSQEFHCRPNESVVQCMENAHIGSPASLMFVALMVAFALYAARDAYDRAYGLRRRSIYADAVLELTEATSGSYLLHFCLIASFLILALFFVLPPQADKQIIDVTYVELHQTTPVRPQTNNAATNNQAAHGHHVDNKPIAQTSSNSSHAAPSQPRQQASAHKSIRSEHNAQSQPQASVMPPEPPAATQAPRAFSIPRPRAMQAPSPLAAPILPPRAVLKPPAPITAAVPTPVNVPSPRVPLPGAVRPAAMMPSLVPLSQTRSFVPVPTLPAPATHSQVVAMAPQPTALNMGGQALTLAAPAPKSTAAAAPSAPSPVAIAPAAGSQGSATGTAAPPLARGKNAGRSIGETGAPVPVGIASPRAGTGPVSLLAPVGSPEGSAQKRSANGHPVAAPGQTGHAGPNGSAGNAPVTVDDGGVSLPAKIDVDFAGYMAELQRRIRKHWFPPPGTESLRVVVVFAVGTDGAMSNLRLTHSSGKAAADNAAVAAVRDAAPFRHLPEGAPPSVDIEFTFDYNVMNGGSGHMRWR